MPDTSLKILFESQGSDELTGSNHPILLDDPNSLWFVASGSVDIFTVNISNNKFAGSRYYFLTIPEGEIILGLESKRYGNERALLAVGTAKTKLLRLNLQIFTDYIGTTADKEEICRVLDNWVHGLSYAISKDLNPETNLLIEPDRKFELGENIKCRSRKGICWLQFIKGNALFIGVKELAIPGESILFPLSNDSWIQTIEKSQIATFSTTFAIGTPGFWIYLDFFHEQVLFCDFLNTRLVMVDEINRLVERSSNQEHSKTDAFYKIASVLNTTIEKSIQTTDRDPLVSACKHIAGYAGIDLVLPKQALNEVHKTVELNDIVRSSRFRTREVALNNMWWKSDSGPLLGFTFDNNQPVALIPNGYGKYHCINPQEATRVIVNQASAATLKPLAIQFYRPFPDKIIKGKDLVSFGLKGTKKDFLLIFFVGITGGLLALMLPVLTGIIFDKVIPGSDYRELYVFALAILVAAIAISLFQLVRSFALLRIETKLDFQLQAAFWDRILNMPLYFFRCYSSGELASKTNTITNLRKALSRTVINTLVSSLFALFNYFLLFVYDPLLALITTILLILSTGIFIYYGLRIKTNQRQIIQSQNKISGLLFQFLNSISKLKIAGTEIFAFHLWADRFSLVKKASFKVKFLSGIIQVFTSLIPVFGTILIFGIIVYGNRPLSTGGFVAFYSAFMVTIMIIVQLGMAGISYYSSIPMVEDLKPILSTLPENETGKHEIESLSGEIEVNEINFRYDKEGPQVLKNISMQIMPGQYVAVVGPSGSGKSTLIRLLLGFEKPESGSIYYDRQDLANFDPTSVRRQIGSVLQETRLAPGTILSNIIGISNATIDDAWAAAEKVGLDEDIRQMPMGMFTIITDGLSTLSGGQRQRIVLAKAMVPNPRILFLDEATSSLDNETQRTVTESLKNLQATRLIIAHRLSTVMETDRIYVLDNGQIVEEGNYNELILRNAYFAELVKRQMLD